MRVRQDTGSDQLVVFLVEPYFTGSHRSWAESLARYSRHEIHVVQHAGGFWKWRMQGAALTLARDLDTLAQRAGPPDLLVVSEMVNLPALLGLARHAIGPVPVAMYLHENQLTYPLPDDTPPDHTYPMINWLSMAAADRVVFNSEYHRHDLMDALPRFLRQFPDHRHHAHIAQVGARTDVIPVGVDPALFDIARTATDAPPLVLWNHRWEYDKDPETFFGVLFELADEGVEFNVAIAGERFQAVPAVFDHANERLGARVVEFGTAPPPRYRELLASADVVVSTARHEFFGVAVAEAIAAGALPLVPNRLAYPELVPRTAPFLYNSRDVLVERLRWALTDARGRHEAAAAARVHVQRFAWPVIAPLYDRLYERLACNAIP